VKKIQKVKVYNSIHYNCGATDELIISSPHGDIKKLMRNEPKFVLKKDYKKLLNAYKKIAK
jgi:hypothetical protein